MSSAVAWRTWEGQKIEGKFPLRQWLGGSDHSAVFLTERPDHPHKAAIKLIAADGANADLQLARWRENAKLSHPHLIRIFETGSCRLGDTRLLYVVLECADEDLSQILPHRPLSPSEVTELLPPLLDALGYLHGRGFVHGRVKPSNVLAIGNQLKLSSDDVLPAQNGSSARRRRDVYDAPETAMGVASPASDMWSVGATLVATLVQNTTFSGEASRGDPGLPSTMPEPFRGIARECLHFDPKRRCSIPDVLARLQPAARSVPAPVPVPALPPRRSNRGVIAVAVLVVALLGGLLLLSRGKGGQPRPAANPPQAQAPAAQSPSAPAPSAPVVTPAPKPEPAVRPKTAAPSAPARAPSNESATGGEAIHQVLPEIPESARNTITGKIKVSVRVDVDSAGKVTNAKLTSPGPSKYFARKALQAAQEWEFQPPQVSGSPSASVWVLHFRFSRARTEANPERITR